jgi:hypothetical protein
MMNSNSETRSWWIIQTIQEYRDFMAHMNSTPEKSVYMDKVYRLLIDMKPQDLFAGKPVAVCPHSLPVRLGLRQHRI